MLDRNHPYIVFAVGIFLCGIKFPFNWIGGKDENRKRLMQKNNFGLTWNGNDELNKAWDNLEKEGRTLHDVTDVVVEWSHVPEWQSYATKFLCSLFVYSSILLLVVLGLLVWSLIPNDYMIFVRCVEQDDKKVCVWESDIIIPAEWH